MYSLICTYLNFEDGCLYTTPTNPDEIEKVYVRYDGYKTVLNEFPDIPVKVYLNKDLGLVRTETIFSVNKNILDK